ncbi:prolipodiacylglyceryl transferase family protein, partial [Chlamydia psittaci 06-1683]
LLSFLKAIRVKL